jgi:subtilisin family serine protease
MDRIHSPEGTHMNGGDPYARFWEQLEEVHRQHPGSHFDVGPAEARPGTGVAPRYVYERRRLLAREADLPWVRQNIDGDHEPTDVPGLVKLTVAEHEQVPAAAHRLNEQYRSFRNDPAARNVTSPHYLVSIAPVNLCPADEPDPLPSFTPVWPPAVSGPSCAGVKVLVVDTGLPLGVQEIHPLLAGISAETRVPTEPSGPIPGGIKEYAGHGMFIAGILRSVAPDVDVQVSNALKGAGALPEANLCGILLQELAEHGWPDIISLSAGATSMDNTELLGLEAFLDALAAPEHANTVLVAAAGNDGRKDAPFWPAASAATHDGIISVGALRHTYPGRACFSNYGDSVTVFARGERLTNVFLRGLYSYRHEVSTQCRYHPPALYPACTCVTAARRGDVVAFDGRARWSGTSFATPLVAGMIAVHMTVTGSSDARQAARDLIETRALSFPDVDGEMVRGLL